VQSDAESGLGAAWNGLTPSQKRTFIIIIVAALLLRLGMAFYSDNFNHPDENFQIMEQAHRIVFGYGFVPWEYRLDARSWIVPGIMSLFLYPFKWLGLDRPDIYVPAIRMAMGVISLFFIFLTYFIASRLHSSGAGLWAAFLTAVWYEMVYFAVRPLSEVWAALFFLWGVALMVSEPTNRRFFWGTFLICMGMAIRINYIPAGIVAIILFISWRDKKMIRTAAISILASIMAIGLFELITLGRPFVSYLNFIEVDRTFFMKDAVGTVFSVDYIYFLGYSSLFLFWVIWLAGLANWRQSGKLAFICLIIILAHILLPAKAHQIDYRHVFLIIPVTLTMGGILIAGLQKYLQNFGLGQALNTVMIMLALEISSAGAMVLLPAQKAVYSGKTIAVYEKPIFYNNPHLQAYLHLSGRQNIVGIYDNSDWWFRSGGYYYLNKNIPIYFPNNPPSDPAYISHIISRNKDFVPATFRPVKAFDDFVIYERIDHDYPYKVDRQYTFDIFQSGIDDNPALLSKTQ
jgi:hypothetical protein